MECIFVGDHVTYFSFSLSFPGFSYKNSNFPEFCLRFWQFLKFPEFSRFSMFSMFSRIVATLVLFSSWVLGKFWVKSETCNKVLVQKLTSSRRNCSRLTIVWNVSFCDYHWSDIFENNISAEERVDLELTERKVSEINNILILEHVNWSYDRFRQHYFHPS